MLTGCVEFLKGENRTYSLFAYLVKGKWFFSEIFPTDLVEGTNRDPCNMKDYESILNHDD